MKQLVSYFFCASVACSSLAAWVPQGQELGQTSLNNTDGPLIISNVLLDRVVVSGTRRYLRFNMRNASANGIIGFSLIIRYYDEDTRLISKRHRVEGRFTHLSGIPDKYAPGEGWSMIDGMHPSAASASVAVDGVLFEDLTRLGDSNRTMLMLGMLQGGHMLISELKRLLDKEGLAAVGIEIERKGRTLKPRRP